MQKTLGKRIAELRKAKGFKQENLAEKLAVSPQAVSKWENDQTCPDIGLLPLLAETLGVTVDELLTGNDSASVVHLSSPKEKKDIKDMVLRMEVDSAEGDKVRFNVPLSIVETLVASDSSSVILTGVFNGKDIDLKQILNLAHSGVLGNLFEVESADGDTVRIFVE